MREYGIGQSVPRVEDRRLLTGLGNYTDDRKVAGQAHMAVVRSPHAAARVISIDSDAATAMPGVLAVLTGKDADADGLGGLSCSVKRRQRDGQPMIEPPFPILAHDAVNMVGVAVAIVVAERLDQALDAAEMVDVDYEVLDAATDTGTALDPGVPQVWQDVANNESFYFTLGDQAAVEDAFAAAAHVVDLEFTVTRVSANTMEPRGAIGFYDPSDERYTLYAGMQSPHRVRSELAGSILRIPEARLRIIAPDMGGGFGMRGAPFAEHALVLWAARRLGRPVRWVATRSEALATDYHARDNVSSAGLALDADGKFLGLRVSTKANLGGYLSFAGPHSPTNNLGGLSGVYTTPQIFAEVRGAYTHTSPTTAYRGAGRPEASYAVERLIDTAAVEIGIDPVELRRRNLIPNDALPYDTGFVFTYDTGDFEAVMDKAVEVADRAGFTARQAAARDQGKLRGLGIACVIEIAGGPLPIPNEESAAISFESDGGVTVAMGTHSHGQGHETAFRQIASELLGLEFDQISIVYGDTDKVHHGKGTFGSRSISVGGAALQRASEKIIDKAQRIAAHLLETAEADIRFDDGNFIVEGTDRSISLTDVAKAAYAPASMPTGMEIGLAETAIVLPPGPTYPNGCHVCEVEIDRDTGVVEIVNYVVVDDCGRMLNPMLVKGQVHGGIAQGAGQALMEEVVYDSDSGQLLTGSYMDYTMPRADDFPSFEVVGHEVPSDNNPFGFKGAGEAGTVGALPAVMNAVCDALRPLGVRNFDMPATSHRVWQAIQDAEAT
ncbi:MAG: xanthine dehydrogenase family protein molybdopterin-binding subunit [Alphaproteobacteria bacterium]|nr:xanthine dehydrogenase family protein molybdopterin-binding subunit [Alphaproteobacteria bacterium]